MSAPRNRGALVANHWFHSREKLGRSHHSHGHSRPPEDRLDDLAVIESGYQNTLSDVIPADDSTRGHSQVEDRISGRRQLVHHLLRRRSAIESAGIAFFKNDHAAAP